MANWRLIISPPEDAFTNMAVDEAILQMYTHKGGIPTLRIYGWKPPAISLGFSQTPDDALSLAHCRRNNIDFVRRITGGEAIYHDQEITYSLVCRKSDLNISDSVRKSFRLLTTFVFNAYRKLGFTPHFASDLANYRHGDASHFCFATIEKFDIIINNKKIGGNAQKRTKDIIFQHGSIPIALDFKKIKTLINEDLKDVERKVTCLNELLKSEVRYKEVTRVLIDSFKSSYNVGLNRMTLSRQEKDLSHTLLQEKYKTKQWNYFKRSRIIKREDWQET
jgi:lipoate-protein ligase A